MYSTAYDMFLWTRFLLGLADVPLLEPSTLAVGYPPGRAELKPYST